MSTRARVAASRSNARKGRGPRTAAGKSKAKRNALRHGLSAVTLVDTVVAPRIEAIARRLCGADANPPLREQAVIIAENHVLLARVRMLCLAAIERRLQEAAKTSGRADPGIEFGAIRRAMPEIERLERFERRAWRDRSRAMRSFIGIKARA
jgi:hypothetical protein